ncbi:hypothetical protein NE575_04875 [Clostridium sp. SL.3.18]|nr:hypothetical protein [Clostridium sp. SL.3.18]
MKKKAYDEVMTDLCMKVKKYIEEKDWDSCMELIPRYMERYPNSAVPHNLLGIVLESQGHHPDAMRHFRAAWSLDPTFLPASQNIDAYSLYDSEKDVKPAYTVDDCLPERQPTLLEKSIFFLRRLWTGKRKVQAA